MINDFCVGWEVIVLDDFNLHLVRQSGKLVLKEYIYLIDQLFLDCFAACGLNQWARESTSVSSGNVLDIFLTCKLDCVEVDILSLFTRCPTCLSFVIPCM